MYDDDMSAWPALRGRAWLRGVGFGRRAFAAYWQNIFDKVSAGQINSWAYRWTFSCWLQNGLTVLPSRNLVQNIGFAAEATHTHAGSPLDGATRLESLCFPLEHPRHVLQDFEADSWTDRNVYGITPRAYVRLSIKNIVQRIFRWGGQ